MKPHTFSIGLLTVLLGVATEHLPSGPDSPLLDPTKKIDWSNPKSNINTLGRDSFKF